GRYKKRSQNNFAGVYGRQRNRAVLRKGLTFQPTPDKVKNEKHYFAVGTQVAEGGIKKKINNYFNSFFCHFDCGRSEKVRKFVFFANWQIFTAADPSTKV
uniref:hypothetical protein n=1 Tax=Bartonella sp. CL32QHWL-2 TaxID=3243525 RepID=UPI0035CE9F99